MTKHYHSYRGQSTKRQRVMRSQILVLTCFMVAVAIIGHAGLKEPFKAEITPKSAITKRLPVNADKKVIPIPDQIRIIAQKRNFKWPDYLVKLSYCESRHDPLAIGDQGNSRGLFQIHKKYHPEVSNQQAFNIEFATNWAIDKINEGKQGLWSCNKIILASK